ncbi:hypothetical protein ACI65C_013539 [Semiaphis heraclei]
MEQVKAVKTAKKDLQSSEKQETLPFLHSNKISKQKITDLIFAYIVEEMRPLVTCEKPAFKRLIKDLSGLDDATSLPDRRVMSKELNNKYTSYITIITDLIAKQNVICTTADIWSCNNKSYLVTNSDSHENENDSADSDEEFYGVLTQSEYPLDHSAAESVQLNNANSNGATVQALSYLDSKNKDLNMLNTFLNVKRVFF